MSIIVKNSKTDMYGNKAENIFYALNNKEEYLGHGYVYPNINHIVTVKHPLNIFIDMEVSSQVNDNDKVKDALFTQLMKRAYEIRDEHKDLKARIYHGSLGNKTEKVDYFISKGFIHDEGVYLFEKKLSKKKVHTEDNNKIIIKTNKFEDKNQQEQLINKHNEIFANKINTELMNNLKKEPQWNNFSCFNDGKLIGNIMIYCKEGNKERDISLGHIENIFVDNEWRKKGIGKQLMFSAFNYFIENNIDVVQLEVWNINEQAVKFYESLGFKFVKETESYPGIEA